MKKLNIFRSFDWDEFAKDKAFACIGVKFNESKQMVSCDVVIISDKTDYGDPTISNTFEKFKVSIPGTSEGDVSKYASLMNQACLINNIQKVSVYGDYQDKLSIVANIIKAKE